WIMRSGPSTKKSSQPFTDQNAATPTPSVARPKSVERLSKEKSPVPRAERLDVSSIIRASSTWLTRTNVAHAASPASAYLPGGSIVTFAPESAWNARPAAIAASVVLQTLKLITTHFLRYLIQPGT